MAPGNADGLIPVVIRGATKSRARNPSSNGSSGEMDPGPRQAAAVYVYLLQARTRQRELGAAPQTFTGSMYHMSQFVFRRKTAKRCVQLLYLIAFCVASGSAKACLLLSSQVGILFDHIPDVEVPVIAEVTVINREPNAMLLDGSALAVLNVRVEKMIKGTPDSPILRVVSPLSSCTAVGRGHGFIAGTIQHDPRHGLELLVIQESDLRIRR